MSDAPGMPSEEEIRAIVWRGRLNSDTGQRTTSELLALIRTAFEAKEREIEQLEWQIRAEQEACIHWCGEAAKFNEQRLSAEAKLSQAVEALEPFASTRVPDYLPDDLWTHCESYEFDPALMPAPLPEGASRPRLALWIDGVTIGDFRRARTAAANIGQGEKT